MKKEGSFMRSLVWLLGLMLAIIALCMVGHMLWDLMHDRIVPWGWLIWSNVSVIVLWQIITFVVRS